MQLKHPKYRFNPYDLIINIWTDKQTTEVMYWYDNEFHYPFGYNRHSINRNRKILSNIKK